MIEATKINSMQLMNISTQKLHQWRRTHIGICIINKSRLPIHIKAKFKQSAIYSHAFNDIQLLSNKWSMIVNIGGYHESHDDLSETTNECHLTVFHPSNLTQAYNFELPSFPHSIWNPSIVYDAKNEKLYALDLQLQPYRKAHKAAIFTLNLNANHCKKQWKWDYPSNTLKIDRYDTSVCCVNGNLFVIGGMRVYNPLKEVELFAVNSLQSIRLASMQKKRIFAGSAYHHKFHRIMVASDDDAEMYDINQDKWLMIQSKLHFDYSSMNLKPTIWESEYNPNVLFVSGRVIPQHNRIGIVTEMMDLRATTSKWKVLSLYDIDDSLRYITDIGGDYGYVSHLLF